ncbi:nuclease-related domain-containing protein [Evansella clarkii]|uniref:nuclease-related domain-containing protein n=1 Tax=Evansella clarkii TaxID=79879 RepID=UPI000B4418BE|nr:nuclease-related domain-containing protein [Evansella clarkii]
MAQLVKLSDYISRYETDIYRYPSRFVRLKKERWKRFSSEWGNSEVYLPEMDISFEQETEERKTFGQRLKHLFLSKDDADEVEPAPPPGIKYKDKQELRAAFMEDVFHFQLSWASSTISEKSEINRKYYYDHLLSFFVKELPDSYFIFYEPVLFLEKAPVDFDILILTPAEMWLITALPGTDKTVYKSFSNRFWEKKQGDRTEKLLNPGVALKRMKTVTEEILADNGLEIPVRTAVIAKNSFIDLPQLPGKRTKVIDKRNFASWKKEFTAATVPVKHHQLKIAETLLGQCLTNSELRVDEAQGRIDDI